MTSMGARHPALSRELRPAACARRVEGRTIPPARGLAASWKDGIVSGAKTPGAQRARLLSTILYVVSAVLIVVVIVLYFRDRGDKPQVAPTPASIPGKNELINVIDAFQAQGLTAKVTRGGARVDELTPPGQALDVGGKAVYVFVYTTPDDRVSDSDGVDLTNLTLTALGTPIPPGQLHAVAGSNIIAVLVGGDASLAAKIDAGVKALR